MNRLRELFQIGLRDRWLFANLVLRVLAIAWVASRGSPMFGDSEYYLESMRSIWAGEWGGATFRAPAFAWLLALLGGPVPAIAFQSFALWLIGADLRARGSRAAALLWVFDPVLFLYGLAVMSDGLFAIAVYLSVLVFRRFFRAPSGRNAAILGAAFAFATLARPVGIPYSLLTLAFALFPISAKRLRLVAIAVGIGFALTVPRLYWNASHGEGWTIASQAATFQMSIAAAVEHSGTGLNYTESERKWVADHPDRVDRHSTAVRETLARKWKTWVGLSLKGVARTLFGHANVEASIVGSGRPVVGPGWFSEGGNGVPWSTPEKALWIFGLGFTLIYAAIEYLFVIRRLAGKFLTEKKFLAWTILAAAGFIAAPQLFGDCRFRLPVLALLFAAQAFEQGPRSPSRDRG